ncbi:MAG: hypothetical protein ACLTBV_32030 [Enterocloster bolteae]
MLILFSLIVMRMSGAIALNPMFGRTNPCPPLQRRALCSFCPCYLYHRRCRPVP